VEQAEDAKKKTRRQMIDDIINEALEDKLAATKQSGDQHPGTNMKQS
jgi:hypothetical protein